MSPVEAGSGGFRAARLPGQATRAARVVCLWMEKNPVPPPNCCALDWSVVLTVERLCHIVLKTISAADGGGGQQGQFAPGHQCKGAP